MGTNISGLKAGDEVIIGIKDLNFIKKKQRSHGGWHTGMIECVEKPCVLIKVIGTNSLVKAHSGCVYRLSTYLLTKCVKSGESTSNQAQIISNATIMKALQYGHGGWTEEMKELVGQKVEIIKRFDNRDYRVKCNNQIWRINSKCVVQADVTQQIINAEIIGGNTILHLAVKAHQLNRCIFLVSNGADINLQNNDKMTPIMLAAQSGYDEILMLLVQKEEANLELADSNDNTALYLAIRNSQIKSAAILLSAGADVRTANFNKFNACHLATFVGNKRILDIIIKREGASFLNIQNVDKFAAIHIATINNYIECLKLIIRYNPDINIRDINFQTALHIAVWQRYMKCVEILVENNANLNMVDSYGNTPIHYGILLSNKYRKTGFPLDKDDFFMFNTDKRSGSDNPKDIVMYLAKNGARLDIKNNAGETPLTSCMHDKLKSKLLSIQSSTELNPALIDLRLHEHNYQPY